MDQFTKGVLIVIAIALCAIAVRLWMAGYATVGDLEALNKISDPTERTQAARALKSRMVLIRTQGVVDVSVMSMP